MDGPAIGTAMSTVLSILDKCRDLDNQRVSMRPQAVAEARRIEAEMRRLESESYELIKAFGITSEELK